MRVLITGITGFAGSHLADYIVREEPKAEIWGVKRWRSSDENIRHLDDRVHFVQGDLTDPASVRNVLETAKPDKIFHLAAQSYVGASFKQPRETLATNISMEINLLHGLREKLAGSMLVAGSSEEYGLVRPDECPITEDQPLRPLSPYAVSKVAQDLLAYQYYQSYGVHVVRSRAFNHEGPRRGEVFVTSAFAKQIAEVELYERPAEIHVGNLESKRDFTDVRDMVRAYWLMLEKGEPGEVYNVCTGRAIKIRTVLEYLISRSTVSEFKIVEDAERMRPSDVPLLHGSCRKFKELTGWEPVITLEETLDDTLDYWRARCREGLALIARAG